MPLRRTKRRPLWARSFVFGTAAVLFISVVLVLGHSAGGRAAWAENVYRNEGASADVLVTAAVTAPAGVGARSLSTAPPGGRSGPLVKVRVTSREGWELLRSLGAELYLRGDGYAVVKLNPDDLTSLDDAGLGWKSLSREVPGRLFYLIPGKGSPSLDPFDISILDQNEEGTLVTAAQDVADIAAAHNYMAVSLDRAWPVRLSGFHGLQFVHDDEILRDQDIYSLIQRVSPDSLGAYIQHLQDYGSRHSDSQQVIWAGSWIKNTLGRFGCQDTLFQAIDLDKGEPQGDGNIIGVNPGVLRPEFRILVGGHYDSTTRFAASRLQDAPGADDNASGTAGGLEIARLTAGLDLDATVEYVFFSGEEQGLRGSRRFANELSKEGVPTDKLFFFNMDMIGNADTVPWRIQLFDDDQSRPLARLAARVTNAYTSLEPVLAGASGGSDHSSLQQVGYAALFAHEFDFSLHYHSPDDLLIHLEMDYAAEVVRMVLATILHLAIISPPPSAISAAEMESGEVKVEWTHSTDADLLGYHVEVVDGEGEVRETVFVTENYAILDPGVVGEGLRVRVRAEDVLGKGDASEAILVGSGDLLVSVKSSNPTGGRAELDIFVPGSGFPVNATIAILDASGRLVRSLHSGTLSRGSHHMEWNGTFSNGDSAPSGVYFYLVKADGVGHQSGKIMVVR